MLKPHYLILIATLFLAFSTMSTPHANAATVVNQGDYVATTIPLPELTPMSSGQNTGMACTIGYVDKARHRAFYAGHCSQGLPGTTVYNAAGNVIGTVGYNPYPDHGAYIPGPALLPGIPNDWAVINLAPGVVAGGNNYSGDAIAPGARTGDTICSYGARTRSVKCGKVMGTHGSVIVATPNAGGIPGDSGGPAWIPGKGFVGVYSILNPVYTAFTRPGM